MICSGCGKEIADGAAFCPACGAKQQQSMREAFQARELGNGVVFTDYALITGGKEYPYEILSEIVVIYGPNQAYHNYYSEVLADGQTIKIVVDENHYDRFLNTITKVNAISAAARQKQEYKYVIQNERAHTKYTFYSDFYKYVKNYGGFRKIVGTSQDEEIVRYSSISAEIRNMHVQPSPKSPTGINPYLVIKRDGTEELIPVSGLKQTYATQIVDLINNSTSRLDILPQSTDTNDKWIPYTPTGRFFALEDGIIEVSEALDKYNNISRYFRQIADSYAMQFMYEYKKYAVDLTSFIEFFPTIFHRYLFTVCSRGADIMISEGVWTETAESIRDKHMNRFQLATGLLAGVLEMVEAYAENNTNKITRVTNWIPNLVGGGFGIEGAIVGIAQATAFNIIRDGVENKLLTSANNLKPAQKQEIFSKLTDANVFVTVKTEFNLVMFTVVEALKKAGNNIWIVEPAKRDQARNLFTNISNPYFPKDKKFEALKTIFELFPYDQEYYRYIVTEYNVDDEVIELRKYFGFEDLDTKLIESVTLD